MARERDQELLASFSAVMDPVLFQSLGELDAIEELKVRRGTARLRVRVPGPDYPATSELRRRLLRVAGEGIDEVDLELVDLDEQQREELGAHLLGTVAPSAVEMPHEGHGHGPPLDRPNPFAERTSPTRVLCIASGKGGVGKSSITVNLAVALAQEGYSVGILDADIYGFSVPKMIGVGYPPNVLGKTIVPPVAHGVRVISIGFFVDEDQAIAWRGPMLHRAIEQFLVDVYWGAPDFLLIDMPPGTGDIALSVAQQLPRAEIYVVTTPQPSAERVAQRVGSLAKQMKIPVRGVIENMSSFVTPDGQRFEPFGHGGGRALAKTLAVELLAEVPLELSLREGSDIGAPIVATEPEGEVGLIFAHLAKTIAKMSPTRIYRRELSIS
ncbi:MAG TPA: Mrp/NBP35 family ATP-binding protein [Acidimicrobiales bacterium]|nr:Mrp/NBP35 family ATP-binding protein [Acidimicrobiales bacterium]